VIINCPFRPINFFGAIFAQMQNPIMTCNLYKGKKRKKKKKKIHHKCKDFIMIRCFCISAYHLSFPPMISKYDYDIHTLSHHAWIISPTSPIDYDLQTSFTKALHISKVKVLKSKTVIPLKIGK
jgi:hypothetical protein